MRMFPRIFPSGRFFGQSVITEENRWFLPLFTELTVTNVALFTGFAVMVVHCVTVLGFSAEQMAGVMIASSIGLRFNRVLLAPLVDRLPPQRVIPIALLVSILGYLGLGMAHSAVAVGACLLAIGTGYGLNGMLVTTLASYASKQGEKTFPIYALMNIGTNLAASLAPLAANWLRLEISAVSPFYFSAAILLVSLGLSLRISPQTPSAYRDVRFRQAAPILLRQPSFWATLCLVAAGWTVYTQKFAATPLFINSYLHHPELVGLAIAVNAIIILGVSLPLAHWVKQHHIPASKVLSVSFALFALAYGLLGLWPSVSALWVALPLWSLAEALLMPQLNALIAEATSAETRLAGFSLSALATGAGEALGNAAGAAMMTLTLANGHAAGCYLIFACAALIACGAVIDWNKTPSASLKTSEA